MLKIKIGDDLNMLMLLLIVHIVLYIILNKKDKEYAWNLILVLGMAPFSYILVGAIHSFLYGSGLVGDHGGLSSALFIIVLYPTFLWYIYLPATLAIILAIVMKKRSKIQITEMNEVDSKKSTKNKKIASLIIILILIIGILLYLNSIKVFTTKEVNQIVKDYSNDYILKNSEGNPFSEKWWFYHDNELDFDFYVYSCRNYYNKKEVYVSYWKSYIENLIAKRKDEIENTLKQYYKTKYGYIISNVSLSYYNDTNRLDIGIDGHKDFLNSKIDNYNEDKILEESSKVVTELIKKYDLNFENRNKYNGNVEEYWKDALQIRTYKKSYKNR